MSVRAYTVITMKVAESPSFNLWHYHEGLLEALGVHEQLDSDGCGYLIIHKKTVKKAISNCTNRVLKAELKAVLADFTGQEDFIEYICF